MTRPRPPQSSGRFLLRTEPALHTLLKNEARDLGLSLNDYCTRKLTQPVDAAALTGDGPAVVQRAIDLYAGRLMGVVVFGSWARNEDTDASDVDVLIVLDPGVPLRRASYAVWDSGAPRWDGRPIEIHLAHVPRAGGPISGFWAEVALDGLVVFERGRRVSASLGGIRRQIADGRLVRRLVQGHPYWTRVA